MFCEYASTYHFPARYPYLHSQDKRNLSVPTLAVAEIPFSCPGIAFVFPTAILLSLLLSHNLQEIQNWMQSQLII